MDRRSRKPIRNWQSYGEVIMFIECIGVLWDAGKLALFLFYLQLQEIVRGFFSSLNPQSKVLSHKYLRYSGGITKRQDFN